MTDYAAEQAMEIEALEAILMDDLQIFEGTHPDGWNVVGESYFVLIDSREEGEEDSDENLKEMEFVFGHTAKYPDEPPSMRLRVLGGLSGRDTIEGMAVLSKEAEENMGMPMIFQLVTAAKEWIRYSPAEEGPHPHQSTPPPPPLDHAAKTDSQPEEDPEVARKRAHEEEEARRAAIRAHGIRVTTENFNAWKKKFDAERAALMAETEVVKDEERAKRITGKQWFLRAGATADDFEAGALSEDDEQDFHRHDAQLADDEEDFDYEDDDDEGMLECEPPAIIGLQITN